MSQDDAIPEVVKMALERGVSLPALDAVRKLGLDKVEWLGNPPRSGAAWRATCWGLRGTGVRLTLDELRDAAGLPMRGSEA